MDGAEGGDLSDSFMLQGQSNFITEDGSGEDGMHQDGQLGDMGGADGQSEEDALREQDRFLPIANVARIMKSAVPKNGKIAKDAKECVQECVSEFISFITSEASERCHQEKRKTINGEDILFAMSTLGFDNYVEPLKLYLQKYRESLKNDKVGGDGAEGLENLSDEQIATFQSTILEQAANSQGNILYTYHPVTTGNQQINLG